MTTCTAFIKILHCWVYSSWSCRSWLYYSPCSPPLVFEAELLTGWQANHSRFCVTLSFWQSFDLAWRFEGFCYRCQSALSLHGRCAWDHCLVRSRLSLLCGYYWDYCSVRANTAQAAGSLRLAECRQVDIDTVPKLGMLNSVFPQPKLDCSKPNINLELNHSERCASRKKVQKMQHEYRKFRLT